MLCCIKGFIQRTSIAINLIILQQNPGLSFCDVTDIINQQTLFLSPLLTQHRKDLALLSSVFIHQNIWKKKKKILLAVFFTMSFLFWKGLH